MSKKAIIFLLVAFILIAVMLLKKFKPKTMEIDSKVFFNDLVKFVLEMEGGLTNNPNDSASKFPSPTPQKYHTNKGITWKTFTDSSKVAGYKPTANLFLEMPNDIWLKIFKDLYYKKAANISNNEVLNGYLSLWFWGGWAKSLMPYKRVADVLASNISDKEKLRKLVDLRKEYFANVVKANPKNSVFLKGWTNRADKFYNDFNKYLS